VDPALANLLRYFDALDRFDIDGCLACFTDGVIYHHPPYGNLIPERKGDGWHMASGQAELRKLLEFRGPQPEKHYVTAFARDGNTCFNEGFAERQENRNAASWLTIFKVDGRGLISEYHPYSCVPGRKLLGNAVPFALAG